MMFHQIVAPVAGSLAASFVVAALPIAVVLVLLGVLRRPAWQASSAGVAMAFALAALGGVLGKMISPQNIVTGTATTELKGREGDVLARTFKHSLILTFLLGLIVMLQQYVFPGVIPR